MPLFPITNYPQQAHLIFESLALSSGAFYYRHLMRQAGVPALQLLQGDKFAILLGCIFGAGIGNKAVFWLEMPHLFWQYWNTPMLFLAGQSMVGGLLGGLLGVELVKKVRGIATSTGDMFVFPILLGIMIGRSGCFIAGLADGTFGLPTNLPWGIDFGDGISRHPTQIYEIIFALLLWIFLKRKQNHYASQPGLLFKVFLSVYLLWRVLVDGLKPVPYDYGWGISGIQLVCVLVLLGYGTMAYQQWRKL